MGRSESSFPCNTTQDIVTDYLFCQYSKYGYRDFQLMGNQDDVNIIIATDTVRWKIDMQIELSG